jgi:antitoxin component YwqK of YwqJK toxin-antitoxin module
MHGNGKEYNKSGDLIYEGDFKNGKRNIWNIYIYNEHCELIAEKKFVGGIYIMMEKLEMELRMEKVKFLMKQAI